MKITKEQLALGEKLINHIYDKADREKEARAKKAILEKEPMGEQLTTAMRTRSAL